MRHHHIWWRPLRYNHYLQLKQLVSYCANFLCEDCQCLLKCTPISHWDCGQCMQRMRDWTCAALPVYSSKHPLHSLPSVSGSKHNDQITYVASIKSDKWVVAKVPLSQKRGIQRYVNFAREITKSQVITLFCLKAIRTLGKSYCTWGCSGAGALERGPGGREGQMEPAPSSRCSCWLISLGEYRRLEGRQLGIRFAHKLFWHHSMPLGSS